MKLFPANTGSTCAENNNINGAATAIICKPMLEAAKRDVTRRSNAVKWIGGHCRSEIFDRCNKSAQQQSKLTFFASAVIPTPKQKEETPANTQG